MSREDFLVWLINKELTPGIKKQVGVARVNMIKELQARQAELGRLRSAEHEAASRGPRFEDLSPSEQMVQVRQLFRAWPEPLLMLAIEELQVRHPGRVRVLIEGLREAG